jgi:hypothetical protein
MVRADQRAQVGHRGVELLGPGWIGLVLLCCSQQEVAADNAPDRVGELGQQELGELCAAPLGEEVAALRQGQPCTLDDRILVRRARGRGPSHEHRHITDRVRSVRHSANFGAAGRGGALYRYMGDPVR